jgi:predicted  nucleic acid-binding Zn-ribbon protein
MVLGTTTILGTASSPPISADWGIAIAILVIGIGGLWQWAKAKDVSEDSLHEARVLDYQRREQVAAEREAILRSHLTACNQALAEMAESNRAILHEVRELRRSQTSLDKRVVERMGSLQREGAVVMADARRNYQQLSDRVFALTAALRSLRDDCVVPTIESSTRDK